MGRGNARFFFAEGCKEGGKMTFGEDGDEGADKGVWMSVWVEDVDEVHRECVAAELDVTFPPTNMRGTCARCMCGIRTGTFFE